MTETSTCLLWTQSQSPDAGFHRVPDEDDYFQMIRWISFCSTELHKQIFRIVFYDEATDDVKERIRGLAPKRFELLEAHLTDRQFLVGNTFSAADAYLTWFFVLAEKAQLEARDYKNLLSYRDRMFARPKISALIAEDYAKSREMN
ncbi:MAG: glutathione S-transferase family protein [Sneathiella sp.]